MYIFNLSLSSDPTRGSSLDPQVFVRYCASLSKQLTLESSVTGSILIGFKNNGNEREQNTSDWIESGVYQLGMRNSNESPIFSELQTEHSKVAEGNRHWVTRLHEVHKTTYGHAQYKQYCKRVQRLNSCENVLPEVGSSRNNTHGKLII